VREHVVHLVDGRFGAEVAVKPTRSTKRTETTFRSPPLSGRASPSVAPHDQQKRARSGLFSPQLGHGRMAGV
jgi:hypothetical protein